MNRQQGQHQQSQQRQHQEDQNQQRTDQNQPTPDNENGNDDVNDEIKKGRVNDEIKKGRDEIKAHKDYLENEKVTLSAQVWLCGACGNQMDISLASCDFCTNNKYNSNFVLMNHKDAYYKIGYTSDAKFKS